MSLVIGSNVGRYEIRSLLGEGGMGQVYLAYDPSLRRRVALKLISGSELKQSQLLRFEQELVSRPYSPLAPLLTAPFNVVAFL